MAPAECELGVGLGLGAKFLNDRLAGLGPQSPLGNLHGQEQCFIKTGKIIEEKCTCKGTGIYREQPCLHPRPERMDSGRGHRGVCRGAELSPVRPPTAHPGLGAPENLKVSLGQVV